LLSAARDDPEREAFLRRFVDQESKVYLNRFYRAYQGLSPDEALATLAHRTRPFAKRLAVVFLSVRSDASRQRLGAFLHSYLPHEPISDDDLWDLYQKYDPQRFSLEDRGYLAGVHPLELWLVNYLQHHPNASREDVTAASVGIRQEVYGWLFKGHRAHKQDVRIRILLEEDAFERILEDWQRQGYPFGHLVPAYGTAIGSSGDRPDALADLIGIILNDGVRLPAVDLQRMHFAAGAPYDTEVAVDPQPQPILAPEVAEAVRQALLGVVAEGTARRLSGVYRTSNGAPLPVGGKTGTGDNRVDPNGFSTAPPRSSSFSATGSMARSPLTCRDRSLGHIISPARSPFSCSRQSNLSSNRYSDRRRPRPLQHPSMWPCLTSHRRGQTAKQAPIKTTGRRSVAG
jgi:hypothetical protein